MSDPTNADAGRALEGCTNCGADTGVAPPAPGSDLFAREAIRAMVTKIESEIIEQNRAYDLPAFEPSTTRAMAWARWSKQIETAELRRLIAATAAECFSEDPWKHVFMEIWRRLKRLDGPNTD